jgi:alpha-galactosidase
VSLKLTFFPNGLINLMEDKLPLGNANFQVFHAGEDILAASKRKESRISSTGCSTRVNLGSGQEITLDTRIRQSGDNWVGLGITLTNTGKSDLDIDLVRLPRLTLDASVFPPKEGLWVMQGAAVKWGQDFACELPVPYQRDNYLGHLQDAEGGGIPVNYFWKKGLGVALMHIEPVPQEWYMPAVADEKSASTSLERREPLKLKIGETFKAPAVIISVHHGDFYEPLDLYRALMEEQNVHPGEPTPACYEPAWCSWGYGFDINAGQMQGVLPVLKDLNIKWMTLDDRWFDAYGDWNPRKETFPGGGEELRKLNDALHTAGYKDQIWWYPLCAEDGHGKWASHTYIVSDILKEHPNWVVLDTDGKVARNNRHLAMLCPALPEVQEYTRKMTERFIRDWDFDGHKLDNIYSMPACHNPAHHHKSPEESIEAFAKVYQIILDTTLKLKPDSVIQICPCGTPILHSLTPAANQTVTADPTSSMQIRQRIKFYKGLMGSRAAVFADHVELSNNQNDFASEIGTGGVPATKFVFPENKSQCPKGSKHCCLPPRKQTRWKKWFALYNQHRISEGEYLNLYDLAFDEPEGHAIRKDNGFYFSFYAKQFHGEVELRGLGNCEYQVMDIANDKEMGVVSREKNRLSVNFRGSLLLHATPME